MHASKKPITTPRRLPRTKLGTATVEAILGAAAQILEHEGADRLTTNQIAELAGVSIGSLYQYFPNKESLLGALQDRYDEDTLARVATALDGAHAFPIETVILRVGFAVIAAKHAQRPIHRWLVDWRPATGTADRYRARLDAIVELVGAFLAQRTDLQISNPRGVAFVLVHAIEGVIEAAMERPHEDAMQIARDAMAMVTAFVRAR